MSASDKLMNQDQVSGQCDEEMCDEWAYRVTGRNGSLLKRRESL